MWRGAAGGQAALRQRSVPDPDPPPAAGPGRRASTGSARCSGAPATEAEASAAYEVRQLDVARDALLAALGSYAPRLLGVYETPQGPCSEPLEFLSALYNGEMRPVLLPMQDLGAYLPYRRISFGAGDGRARARAPISSAASSAWSRSRTIPARPRPACSTSCCGCRSSSPSRRASASSTARRRSARMNLALRRMRSAEDEAVSLRADLVQRQGRGRRRPRRLRRASHDDRGPRRHAGRGRRRRRRGAGGARRSRHHRGARGDRARAGLLGAVPRQLQIYRPARRWSRPAISRASPAATTSRSARPRAIIGARR